MSISVDFPAEIEQALQHQAAVAGMDLPSFVREVVTETLAGQLKLPPTDTPSHEEYARRLDAWIQLHPQRPRAVDDSRESIYAGRGE